jgi:hypothetical protein
LVLVMMKAGWLMLPMVMISPWNCGFRQDRCLGLAGKASAEHNIGAFLMMTVAMMMRGVMRQVILTETSSVRVRRVVIANFDRLAL